MKVGQGLGTAFAEVCSAEDTVSMGRVLLPVEGTVTGWDAPPGDLVE